MGGEGQDPLCGQDVPAHDQVEGWNCSLYFSKTILGSRLFWSCSLQINTGTFPTAFGSVDLEHLNLAFCYQGAFTIVSSLLSACCSGNIVLCFLPCPRPLSFCVWVTSPQSGACWAWPPGSCVLQGEGRGLRALLLIFLPEVGPGPAVGLLGCCEESTLTSRPS